MLEIKKNLFLRLDKILPILLPLENKKNNVVSHSFVTTTLLYTFFNKIKIIIYFQEI